MDFENTFSSDRLPQSRLIHEGWCLSETSRLWCQNIKSFLSIVPIKVEIWKTWLLKTAIYHAYNSDMYWLNIMQNKKMFGQVYQNYSEYISNKTQDFRLTNIYVSHLQYLQNCQDVIGAAQHESSSRFCKRISLWRWKYHIYQQNIHKMYKYHAILQEVGKNEN